MLERKKERIADYGSPKTKVYDFMYRQNSAFPNEIALFYFGRKYTYKELFEKIEKYAKAVTSNGVCKGDYVTIVLPNIPELVFIFYACNRIGAVVNLLDPRTNAKAILERTNKTSSKIIFAITDIIKDKIEPYLDDYKTSTIVNISPADSLKSFKIYSATALLIRIVYFLKQSKSRKTNIISLKSFLANSSKSAIDSQYEEDVPCSIVYTSGTDGGKAKGALLSNESYNSMPTMQMSGQEGYSRQNTFLGCIPFFVAYGSINGMHNSLCNGWTIQLIPKFKPNDFDLLIKKYKPNNALGVPRCWESIVDNGRLDKEDLSFLILPTCGGDKIPPSAVEKINTFFAKQGSNVKLIVGYGATELGGAFSVTISDYSIYEPGSVGVFMKGVSGRIFNPETGLEETGEERIGELYVHSPSMMLGYYKDDEQTDAILWKDENGNKYYKTGDKVRIDSRGVNWVIDRYKRVIARPDGHKVAASPIENVILENEGCLEAAVVGIGEEGKGAIPTAFVKIDKTKGITEDEMFIVLDKLVSDRIAGRDRALAYIFVDELPYTLMGKIDYRRLEKTNIKEMNVYWVKDPLVSTK